MQLAKYKNLPTAHTLSAQLTELRAAEKDASRQIDILKYQINEIEAAQLKEGEEEDLRAERTRLANAEGIASQVQEALQLLEDGTPESPSITDMIGQVTSALNNLSRLDSEQAILSQRAQGALDELVDLATTLRDYLETIEFNPKRLDQVEERLNQIQNLKRKFGETISAVLQFTQESRLQLESITHASERIAQLENEENELLVKLSELGETLRKQVFSSQSAGKETRSRVKSFEHGGGPI
jgi:DNA repair protein RecN (Recombination protein N)